MGAAPRQLVQATTANSVQPIGAISRTSKTVWMSLPLPVAASGSYHQLTPGAYTTAADRGCR